MPSRTIITAFLFKCNKGFTQCLALRRQTLRRLLWQKRAQTFGGPRKNAFSVFCTKNPGAGLRDGTGYWSNQWTGHSGPTINPRDVALFSKNGWLMGLWRVVFKMRDPAFLRHKTSENHRMLGLTCRHNCWWNTTTNKQKEVRPWKMENRNRIQDVTAW